MHVQLEMYTMGVTTVCCRTNFYVTFSIVFNWPPAARCWTTRPGNYPPSCYSKRKETPRCDCRLSQSRHHTRTQRLRVRSLWGEKERKFADRTAGSLAHCVWSSRCPLLVVHVVGQRVVARAGIDTPENDDPRTCANAVRRRAGWSRSDPEDDDAALPTRENHKRCETCEMSPTLCDV